jgi:2-oxoglutarate dehydrogenase E1 component
VLPLLLHGDAAFAGQGVVAECFGLSGLKGYRTGGTIHFIVNNQIGFTTNPRYSRSSPYPSDVAKMIEAPIFHVNGDDPEAVVFAAKVATEYPAEVPQAVVIDMFCYRRFGHNEGDEPAFTQPLMYKKIKRPQDDARALCQAPDRRGRDDRGRSRRLKADWRARLDKEFEAGRLQAEQGRLAGRQVGRLGVPTRRKIRRGKTGVDEDAEGDRPPRSPRSRTASTFTRPSSASSTTAPRRSTPAKASTGRPARRWHSAPCWTKATRSACPARTRARHLHAAPLGADRPGRPRAATRRSTCRPARPTTKSSTRCLSEEAVLGFEYGYSLADPNTLTLWEAQFGDFANGAQVVFDQFISSGERKWLRMSGLVCLLPHGYEGQGPGALLGPPRALPADVRRRQHAGGQLHDAGQLLPRPAPSDEARVPQAADRDDAEVAAAPQARVSKLSELAKGHLLPPRAVDDAEKLRREDQAAAPDKIRRVVLCSGKVYYDLLEEREKRGIDDVYLMRLEQLYPWPLKSLMELTRFKNAEMVWCQEEPKNMGGWTFVDPWIELTLDKLDIKAKRARYVGRPGLGLDGRRLDEPSPERTRDLPQRGLRVSAKALF